MVTVEKKILIDTLKAVMPGVEKNSVEIEGADTILFKDNKAITYNGTVTITKKFECDNYCFAVKAVDFFNLISKCRDMAVNLDVDSIAGKLKVTSGKTKASLALLDTESISKYAAKVTDGELKDLPADFVEGLKIVPISNNNNPDLAGVAIVKTGDVSSMISTDKLRISTKKLSVALDDMLVDDKVMLESLKLGTPKKYSLVGPWINFVYEDGTRFSAIRKDHTGYPGGKILPALEKFNAIEPIVKGKLPKDVIETVARVNVLSGISEASSEHIVSLTFTKKGIDIYAENQGGSAEESVDWDTEIQVPDDLNVQIWVSSSFITEATLKSMNFKLINRGNGNLAFIFEGDGYTCMVASLKKTA